jgi:hypothetical protein
LYHVLIISTIALLVEYFASSQAVHNGILQGYEMMNMIRKGQVQEVDKGDTRSQAAFIAELFGVPI